jgi:putative salt-induced outer membrane protein
MSIRVISKRVGALAGLILGATTQALADTPPPPPQDVWIGKGEFGFLDSKGNSDAESINGNIDLLRYDGAWKNEFYLGGLYGKNSGIVSADRWETHGQSNYNISSDLFAFGGFRYEHDLFDGFVYQASLTGGLGYKIIDSADTKLAVQAGAGYRELRPEGINKDADGIVTSRQPLDSTGNAIGTLGVDFSHAFNKSTTFTNKFLTEAGSSNVLLTDALALTVKMSTKLALSVGYAVSDNTKPTAPTKRLDTVSTVNLVFSF